MKMIELLFAAGLVLCAQHARANEKIPVADFIKSPTYSSAKISPNGDYLGMIVERGERDVLIILDAKTLKMLQVHQAQEENSVGIFHWIGPKRLMLTTTRKTGRRAMPVYNGLWIAMNVDGSSRQNLNLTGSKTAIGRGMKQVSTIEGPLFLEDTVPEDETRIIVSTFDFYNASANTKLASLNTFTGHYQVLATLPKRNCQFTLNKLHQPTYALCSERPDKNDDETFLTQFYKRVDNEKWLEVGDGVTSKSSTRLLNDNGDGKVSAIYSDGTHTQSFGFINTTSGQFQPVHQDKTADISDTIYASDGVTALAVVTEAAVPQVTMLDTLNADSDLYVSIAGAFPKQFVDFVDSTIDGKKILISVRSEKNPGELYLYDRDTKQVRFLMRNRAWLKASEMADVKSVKIKSRDGIDLYGYLTLPNDTSGSKPFPLIVNPHGGPIGVRDEWGFNWEAQMLASRGYAVLQVNYRGSSGYGDEFEKKGHMQWGDKIQDDIIDATRWVTAEGYADADRICIYGGSFGGYSALMAPIREPGMFKCAVGYVGVYDMNLMDSAGDIPRYGSGRDFIEKTLGEDKAKLKSISPVDNAEKIKIPVFLAAGALDQRAPPVHTERMQVALKKAGNPAEEVIIQAGEMHGFYDDKNSLNLYTKMLDFFDRHIGKK